MKFKNLLSAKGVTLMEAIVASAVLVTMALALSSLFLQEQKGLKQLSGTSSKESIIQNFIFDMIESIAHQQINYRDSQEVNEEGKKFTDIRLDPKNLQFVWDEGRIARPQDCPACKGRLGFIIQPLTGFRGLYLVTLRVTHPTLISNKDGLGFADYQMVVRDK